MARATTCVVLLLCATAVADGSEEWTRFRGPNGTGISSGDDTLSVVSAAAQWEVLAVNALGDEVFATPAFADGQVFVRPRGALYNFGTRR